MATGASGDINLERRFLGALQRAYLLWCERHKKYGRGNISRHGALGCLIRGDDKAARLHEFYTKKTGEFTDESVVDSWLDGANYALMGYLCHIGQWETP
jgi:hypothetical protein